MGASKATKDSREAILDSFIELIGSMGAHQVTLQKAAKKAKVPFSTAHYYFGGDWDKIFNEAVLKVVNQGHNFISAYIQKKSTATSNPIELYIDGTFEWILGNQSHVQLWLFNYYFASIKPESANIQETFINHARQRVLNLAFEAKGRGFYPKLSVTKDVADTIHALVFGLGIMAIMQTSDHKKVNQIKKDTQKLVKQRLLQ